MKVLFVCTGNTCRSPMAEHLFKKMLEDAKRTDVTVSSAGIAPSPWLGFPIEAQQALAEENVVDVKHAAQGLSRPLVEDSDLILTMEKHHKDAVVRNFPAVQHKTHVLNTYAGLGTDLVSGIRDPFGFPAPIYKAVLAEIKTALKEILKKI